MYDAALKPYCEREERNKRTLGFIISILYRRGKSFPTLEFVVFAGGGAFPRIPTCFKSIIRKLTSSNTFFFKKLISML